MTTAEADKLTLDTLDIIHPDHYARDGYPHEEWAHLRREAPLFWFDRPYVKPFWAVTKHEDIVWISRQPKVFHNAPRLVITTREAGQQRGEGEFGAHNLLTMDPPEHGQYRNIVNRRFTPRAVERLQPHIAEITDRVLDGVATRILDDAAETEECDFVVDVSAKLPLAVIAELLGVPHEDWELIFKWTNETIGSGDPEYQEGATAEETSERARTAVFDYFTRLAEERRKNPKDDLTTVLVTSEINGQPLPMFEFLSYVFLLAIAGNETTRNATTGGLLAFIENPGEWEKLKRNPDLIDSAVEEILRWTSPLIHFARTADQDVELRGRRIRKGEDLGLFYPSANRDEDVFEQPYSFRIDREPNRHLAFGIGEHFCLGANLARLELRVMFQQLVDRLEHVELAGPVERLRSSFVGGIKHMPIRYRMRPARG